MSLFNWTQNQCRTDLASKEAGYNALILLFFATFIVLKTKPFLSLSFCCTGCIVPVAFVIQKSFTVFFSFRAMWREDHWPSSTVYILRKSWLEGESFEFWPLCVLSTMFRGLSDSDWSYRVLWSRMETRDLLFFRCTGFQKQPPFCWGTLSFCLFSSTCVYFLWIRDQRDIFQRPIVKDRERSKKFSTFFQVKNVPGNSLKKKVTQ